MDPEAELLIHSLFLWTAAQKGKRHLETDLTKGFSPSTAQDVVLNFEGLKKEEFIAYALRAPRAYQKFYHIFLKYSPNPKALFVQGYVQSMGGEFP